MFSYVGVNQELFLHATSPVYILFVDFPGTCDTVFIQFTPPVRLNFTLDSLRLCLHDQYYELIAALIAFVFSFLVYMCCSELLCPGLA